LSWSKSFRESQSQLSSLAKEAIAEFKKRENSTSKADYFI